MWIAGSGAVQSVCGLDGRHATQQRIAVHVRTRLQQGKCPPAREFVLGTCLWSLRSTHALGTDVDATQRVLSILGLESDPWDKNDVVTI